MATTEVFLGLTLASLDLIISGEEIVVEIPDLELRVVVHGDPATVDEFRQRRNLALMQLLPTPRSIN